MFTSELIKIQLDDQRMRMNKQKIFSGGYISAAEQLRNNIGLIEISDIIERVEAKTE